MTDRQLPSLWKVVLVALLVLAALDGFVRLRDHRLRPPEVWYRPVVQELVADADMVHDEGVRSDVLFVGTSMVIRDVLTEIIEDELDSVDQAHNAGIAAAQTPVVRRWLLEEMLPRLNSPRVVWGISSLDFNGHRPAKVIEYYNAARAARPGILGSVDRVMADVSALSHYRDRLRSPAAWGSIIGLGEAPEPLAAANAKADRLLDSSNDSVGRIADLRSEAARIRDEVLTDWTIGSDEAEAFRLTLEELLEMGVEVVVVLMPVPQVYVDQHPRGEDDFAEFLVYMSGILNELEIPYFDYSRSYRDKDFHDVTHLNRRPAERFSRQLARDLAGLGW